MQWIINLNFGTKGGSKNKNNKNVITLESCAKLPQWRLSGKASRNVTAIYGIRDRIQCFFIADLM